MYGNENETGWDCWTGKCIYTTPAPGTESSSLFMLDNEFGQGSFKSIIKTLAAATGTSKISEAVEASQGMEVQVVIVAKPDKKDPSIMRMNVKKVIV